MQNANDSATPNGCSSEKAWVPRTDSHLVYSDALWTSRGVPEWVLRM